MKLSGFIRNRIISLFITFKRNNIMQKKISMTNGAMKSCSMSLPSKSATNCLRCISGKSPQIKPSMNC